MQTDRLPGTLPSFLRPHPSLHWLISFLRSFGDPTTVPPTPRDTPTSTHFPQPTLETPETNQGGFDHLSGWTPRFAEEYSVFNTTPGNLRGTPGPFPEPSVATPYQPSPGHKRLLSAGSVAVEIASHMNRYSPVSALSALPLPPVDPSRRLPSSPTAAGPFPSSIEADCPSDLKHRSGNKKLRRGTLGPTSPQTVTPPPSARKGEQRLAPKPPVAGMPHEEFETEIVVAGAPQQQQILDGFVSAPMDMFGMPLSAPATAAAFDDTQGFWDPGMSAMDIDFSIPVTDSFHGTHHKAVESIDWGRPNEVFQETGVVPPRNQEILPQKTERLLAPKPPPMPSVDTSMTEAPVFAHSFHISTDDPFASLNPIGGVDPGLLLTRPPSSTMEAVFDHMARPVLMSSLPSPQLPPAPAKEPKRGQVRRSASTRETGKAKKDERAPGNPPIPSSSRPGLLRSASESRARKPISRAGTLPNLLPAVRNGPPASNGRSSSQGSRVSGRISPLKMHQRLSSLSSIPEHSGPRTRTSVRLTIDSRGRARTETTVIVDDKQQTPTRRRRRRRDESTKEWGSSEEESSSTDDEPIIIPSRNSSFSLPQSSAPSYIRPSHTTQNSFSDQNTSSLGIYYAEPSSSQCEADSDAETVMDVATKHDSRGDAMSELRKVRESRQKRIPVLNPNNHSMSSAPFSVSSPISTPSTHQGNQIRCICNTTLSHINGDGYMVQW